ncbi:MAG TPA: hypothetical protein VNG31_05375 [Candidatus Baltobacteraceae bacterium]|nr:hypothetical protein [Candidatus Baltobacteraceae bacterium]
MPWELAVLIIVVAALAFTACLWLVRRLVRKHVDEGHNEVLIPIFLTAGTIYAVLIAFVVIAVWEAHDAANANAAEEASTLTTMYRQTDGMPQAERSELRRLIRGYTTAVVDEEWAIQAKTGGASPTARRYVGQIYRSFGQLPAREAASPISVEFLRSFSTVAADRNRRTLEAGESLPGPMWFALIFGAVIVVGMTFFLSMNVFWLHYVISGAMTVLIGTLLAITLLLNRPFSGPLAIDAGSFEHSIGVYDSVDRGD